MSTAGVVALTLAALMVLTVLGGLAAYAITDRLAGGTAHQRVTPLSTSSSDHQHSSEGAHQR